VEIGRGFIKDGTNFIFFEAPGAQDPFGTFPFGINDRGQIVGEVLDGTGFHSFLFESNRFSRIEVPESNDTRVYGINNSGQMAGTFSGPTSGTHGFITIGGRFFQVDVPGVEGSGVSGINDSGQVVGSASVSGIPGVFNLGFVATPCSEAGTNCVTLPEIGRSASQLVISCPEDIFVGCGPNMGVPVTFTVTATNLAGQPAVVVCSPPSGSLFPVGTNVVSCTAFDGLGNETNCAFHVIRLPLQFVGFLKPLAGADAGSSFSSPSSTVRLGSTLPVKFIASCDGQVVEQGLSSLRLIHYLAADSAEAPLPAKAQGHQPAYFRFEQGGWHFNLDTRDSGMTAGIWLLTATLPDGSEHSAWIQIRD
jgi:hypothetical protein